MNFKFSLKLRYLLLSIFIGLVTCNSFSLAQTKPKRSEVSVPETRSSSSSDSLKLPSRGAPIGRRRGGTSRSTCPPFDFPPTALVPGQESVTGLVQSQSFLASTVAENPTFWVYLPKLPALARTGEFILQGETGEDIERIQLELPSTEGAISINLASDAKYSLAIGKKYHWYFKIYCGEPLPSSDYVFVDAWIERVAIESELENQLQMRDRADYLIYSDLSIWYDALTNLGELLQANPHSNNLKADWLTLLKSIELANLGDLPIVKMYRL